MNGKKFINLVSNIVGSENAIRYAARFGDLDDIGYTNDISGYEALAFYIYTTALTWHSYINEELWSDAPEENVFAFAQVLDRALRKLPAYTVQGGLVYRGYNASNLDDFTDRYVVGRAMIFPGFTSASFRQETAFGGQGCESRLTCSEAEK